MPSGLSQETLVFFTLSGKMLVVLKGRSIEVLPLLLSLAGFVVSLFDYSIGL